MEELDSQGLLATKANPKPRDFTPEDLNKLPYLDAVIKESMRYIQVRAQLLLTAVCFFPLFSSRPPLWTPLPLTAFSLFTTALHMFLSRGAPVG